MKSRSCLTLCAVLSFAVVSACSGSDSSDEADEVTTPLATPADATDTTEQVGSDSDSDSDSDEGVTETADVETTDAADEPTAETAPPATEPPAAPEPLFGTGDNLIGLETADGEFEGRPMLSWTPVDGADHYGVYVYAPDGQIYWAWRGRETSTPLGGDIGNAAGPVAAEGMTWAVIAWDADLLPITVSLVEPLRG